MYCFCFYFGFCCFTQLLDSNTDAASATDWLLLNYVSNVENVPLILVVFEVLFLSRMVMRCISVNILLFAEL